MKVNIVDDAKFDTAVADFIAEEVRCNPSANICFPTGDTPKKIYRELSLRVQSGQLSMASVHAFGLDEWGSLPETSKARCSARMYEQLYRNVDIPSEHIYCMDTLVPDVDDMCKKYEKRIADLGGLNLAIVGVGINGHIGFNEPGSQKTDRTRKVTLSATTQRVAKKYQLDVIPTWGVTLGIQTLFATEKILIIVNGQHKADMMTKLINGLETTNVPVTLLRNHPNCTLILDSSAASLLTGWQA